MLLLGIKIKNPIYRHYLLILAHKLYWIWPHFLTDPHRYITFFHRVRCFRLHKHQLCNWIQKINVENVLFISSIFCLERSLLQMKDMSSVTVRPVDVKIIYKSIFIDFFRPLTYVIRNSFCPNSFPGLFRSSIISWSLKWKIFLVNGKTFSCFCEALCF
jgi:hypothetical protein